MVDGRVEQRVAAITSPIRKARVAAFAPCPVDLLARARRQGACQRLDAAARHVDHRDRRHAHHRTFEQLLPERPLAVLAAMHGQRLTDVVPSGVAGDGLLGQSLHAGIDRHVDGISDVDRRTVDVGPVRPSVGATTERVGRRIGVGVPSVERARWLPQRLERLQKGEERRRHHPAWIVSGVGRARLARHCEQCISTGATRCRGGAADRRCAAEAPLDAVWAGEEVASSQRVALVGVAEIDATGDATPGIAACHVACRDLHFLIGAPTGERGVAFGASPGQRLQHAGIGAAQCRQRADQVGAAQAELLSLAHRSTRSALPGRRGPPRTSAPASRPTLSWTRRSRAR